MNSELQLDPIWRQAALDSVAEFEYGDVIPHEWICERLEIPPRKGLMTSAQHRAIDFELLTKVDGLKEELLVTYQRYLVSVRGVGYKVVEPPEQTGEAMRKFAKDLRKTFGKTLMALNYINTAMLTLEGIQRNEEAKGKLAALRAFSKKRRIEHQE